MDELPVICRGCKYSGYRKVKDRKTKKVTEVKSCNYMHTVAQMQVIADYENSLVNRKIDPYNIRCGFRKGMYE